MIAYNSLVRLIAYIKY